MAFTPAKKITFPAHNDWNGTGTPAENELFRGAEINDIRDTQHSNAAQIDEHSEALERVAIEWKQGVNNYKVFIIVSGKPVNYHGTDSGAASVEARKTTTPGTNAAVWTLTNDAPSTTPDPTTMTFTV